VIDTAMAGRLSAIALSPVGIAAAIMSTVLMTLISVLLALPPIIAQLYGADWRAEVGREIHQSVWISLVLALEKQWRQTRLILPKKELNTQHQNMTLKDIGRLSWQA
jgi:hypothetical protein